MTVINNPFNYSHSRHARKYSPPKESKYSAYKPTLCLEYDRKCVYCRFPDTIKGYDTFGVDHYRPKSKFPELETEYLNLFYCCNRCNRLKGSRWSDSVFVPNPDEHVMIEHLRFKKEVVDPVSGAGKYACELLQLNHLEVVRTRKALLTSLASLERDMEEAKRLEKDIRKYFNKGDISKDELDADLLALEEGCREIQAAMDVISGRI